jgi:hypothetical protein
MKYSDLHETESLFEMSNLRTEDTGLPFVVFVSQKGNARHDVRVKVGTNINASSINCSVSVRNEIEVVAGVWELNQQYFKLLADWIVLNRAVIIDYWDSNISTSQMIKNIKMV